MARIILDLVSNDNAPELLQQVIDWKPTEIILWERAVGYHIGSSEFSTEYYRRLPGESLPKISFVDGIAGLRGRSVVRPAVMIDPGMQIRDSSPRLFEISRAFLNAVFAGSRTTGGDLEMLLFYTSSDIRVTLPDVESASIDLH